MLERKIRKKTVANNVRTMLKSGIISATILVAISTMFSPEIDMFIVIVNFLSGLIIGTLVPGIYLFSIKMVIKSEKIKELPYYMFIFIHWIILLIATFLIYLLVGSILFREYVWLSSNIQIAFIMAFFIAIIFTSDTILKQFLGNRFVKDIITGKYHEPKEKRVIMMFIDMANSSAIAEQLSHGEFYRMLNFFFGISEKCAFLFNGEIYKYLGDGVIIVWDSSDENYLNTYDFIKEFDEEINRCQKYFNEKYGAELEYTMGLHEGMAIVGELGDVKKELGYWGDTVNTVQRIQGMCKEYSVKVIASLSYYKQLIDRRDQPEFKVKIVEDIELKGKENLIDIVCIELE